MSTGPVKATYVRRTPYSPEWVVVQSHEWGPSTILGTYPHRQAAEAALVELLATEAAL